MTTFSVSEIFKEARRRRVFRVAAIYAVGAWVFLQVADLAFPAIGIPESAIRYVWLGALLAFPIAIIFGWRYDIVNGRVVLTGAAIKDIELRLNRADYLILTALVSVGVAIVVGFSAEIADTQRPQDPALWGDDVDLASIAVLPFVNMSPDPDNEYFADGLSEELLNGLANVSGLRVTARTSSFRFKNRDMDIREIGQRLNAANVLEGSVRIANNRFRITAQLINSESGVHRWSQTYDRPMRDVFAVQDEITKNIVEALDDLLRSDEESTITVSTTNDPQAYADYLRGRDLIRNLDLLSGNDRLFDAIGLLKSAIKLDPNFSDGFVTLADAYHALSEYYDQAYLPIESENASANAEEAARAAIALAPRSSEALRALGIISNDPVARERVLRQSIDANSNNADAHLELATVLLENDHLDEGVAIMRKSHLLDPLNADSSEGLAGALEMAGNLKEASTYFRLSSQLRSEDSGEVAEPSKAYLERIAGYPSQPVNLKFETAAKGLYLQKQCRDNYELSMSSDAYFGKGSAHLHSLPDSVGWCNTAQSISAERYRDRYIRLVGMVKTKDVADAAYLWLRIDGWKFGFALGFDAGLPGTLSGDNEWSRYELALYVPTDAYAIHFGAVLSGEGEMWMDDFHFDASDSPDFD